MRVFITFIVFLLATPAMAYDLHNLSSQDVLLIGEALDAMPHGKVAALYARIQQQLSAEDAASAAETRAKIEKDIRGKIAPEPKLEEGRSP